MTILSRQWELSVIETCPYREVPLYFFSSSILSPYCPILFFKCVLKIILSISSAAILLIQTRWVRLRAEERGTNFDPSARKHQN